MNKLTVYLHGRNYFYCKIKNNPQLFTSLELIGIETKIEQFYSDKTKYYYSGNFPKELLQTVVDTLKMINVGVEVNDE
jgi:hypothetical protein